MLEEKQDTRLSLGAVIINATQDYALVLPAEPKAESDEPEPKEQEAGDSW